MTQMMSKIFYRLLVGFCVLSVVFGLLIPTPFLLGDAGAAALAAVGVSPLVSAVDRAITLNAAGKQELWTALRENVAEIGTGPWQVLSSVPFRWLWFVYSITYFAANSVDTLSESVGTNPAIPVLIASTTANTIACIAKDAAFARKFGKPESKNQVPVSSYIAWLGAFTLPDLLVAYHVPAVASRLAGPVVAQYFTTPLHLAGLAFYDLSPGESVWEAVKEQFPATVVARQLRILPAFSLGTIANTYLRDLAHHTLT